MIEWFEQVFGWLPKEAFAALISMVPVIELRGGLPYAILSGINPWLAVPLCIVSNLIPVPFIQLDEAHQTVAPHRGEDGAAGDEEEGPHRKQLFLGSAVIRGYPPPRYRRLDRLADRRRAGHPQKEVHPRHCAGCLSGGRADGDSFPFL